MHYGIDFGPTVPDDTTQDFTAGADGVVDRTGFQEDKAGNYIVIDHGDGYESKYLHAAEPPDLSPGTPVRAGSPIGKIGNSGNSTVPHLHFEIHKGGEALDPDAFLKREKVMLGK